MTSAVGGSAGDNATELTLDRLVAMRLSMLAGGGRSLRGLTHFPGLVRGPKRGHGLDFDDLRAYADGDDVRHIDWNVTARTGKPHTRLYREERERAITVAVDFRASMFTGTACLKAVRAGELAAAILWQASADGDRAGAAVFDAGGMSASRPAAGTKGALAGAGLIAGRFAGASATAKARGAAPDAPLADCISWLNGAGRASGAALLITGLDGPGQEFEADILEAGRRRRLAILHLLDPCEAEGLPAGRYAYEGAAGSTVFRADAFSREALLARLASHRAAVHEQLERAMVPVLPVLTTTPPGDVLLALEARGWL
ncbi:MAG: DUF58 domain-containing protein [Notoacmeibacter sp.]|nr:DUF58 domain-containing protein [Notoacmeibacter sp.]MCC0031932.1 DUF58 domain-containing protein [Brucellaceae bacterium]